MDIREIGEDYCLMGSEAVYSVTNLRIFRGTYCLHLQAEGYSPTRLQNLTFQKMLVFRLTALRT
jgi:hypothetical protein